MSYFKIKSKKKVNLQPWKKITQLVLKTKNSVNIGVIGKYVELKDAYKSLDEALTHGGIDNNLKINLIRIESDNLKPSEIKINLKIHQEFWYLVDLGKEELKENSSYYVRQRK